MRNGDGAPRRQRGVAALHPVVPGADRNRTRFAVGAPGVAASRSSFPPGLGHSIAPFCGPSVMPLSWTGRPPLGLRDGWPARGACGPGPPAAGAGATQLPWARAAFRTPDTKLIHLHGGATSTTSVRPRLLNSSRHSSATCRARRPSSILQLQGHLAALQPADLEQFVHQVRHLRRLPVAIAACAHATRSAPLVRRVSCTAMRTAPSDCATRVLVRRETPSAARTELQTVNERRMGFRASCSPAPLPLP